MCVRECLVFACASKERAASHDNRFHPLLGQSLHFDQLLGQGFDLGVFLCFMCVGMCQRRGDCVLHVCVCVNNRMNMSVWETD